IPDVSTMKPEPSELVLCGCRSPPRPPGPPRRFLKKSSKNSSNGEPGGNCGVAPRPSAPAPLASTVCEVEMLTTASITFSATSAMPSGPRAQAGPEKTGAEISTPLAPRQIAARTGRRRWLKAGIAPVISASLLAKRIGFDVHSAPERGCGASIRGGHFVHISAVEYGEKRDAATHNGVDTAGFGRAVIPGRCKASNPESRDSPVRNGAPEVWSFGPSRNDSGLPPDH